MCYKFLRRLLFTLDPELAHDVTLTVLNALSAVHAISRKSFIKIPKMCMGLSFPNPLGLAAGFDKNGDYVDALASLGFGFIEIGSVTPKPQGGNPKPRLFRIPQAQALINRMGFNNKGVDYLVARLKKTHYQGILGISIAKNLNTPLEYAHEDYLHCMQHVYPYASYMTVNISSPNTKGLRHLQSAEALNKLLICLKERHEKLVNQHRKYVPLLIKLSPDLDEEQVKTISQLLLHHKIDGVIATNTTTSRENISELQSAQEEGGLSGKPLAEQSTKIIHLLKRNLGDKIPIVGVGGIFSAEDAKEKFDAGADLIQLYTGLIYQGPKLIREILNPDIA